MRKDGTLGCIVLLLAAPFIAIASAALRGWALQVLWGWFVVPLGVPALSITGALGFSLVVTMFTYTPQKTDKDQDATDQKIEALMLLFGWPLIVLGMGALVRWFAS